MDKKNVGKKIEDIHIWLTGQRITVIEIYWPDLRNKNNENGRRSCFENRSPTVKLVIKSVCKERNHL